MAKAYSTQHGMRKRCSKCLQELTLDRFHKSNQTHDGLNSRCALCQTTAVRECLERKDQAGIPRVTEAQRAAKRARSKVYYRNDPGKHKELSASYRKENPEKAKASIKVARGKKPEYWRAYALSYYHANAESIRPRQSAQTMKRYAGKVLATPAWANVDAIQRFYDQAARITAETGVAHQVDHIIPIMSKTVCGLHIEHNMQILDKSANIKKGNRHWPDMP